MYLLFHAGYLVSRLERGHQQSETFNRPVFKSVQDMENGGCAERGGWGSGLKEQQPFLACYHKVKQYLIWILTTARKAHSVRVTIGETGFSKDRMSPQRLLP